MAVTMIPQNKTRKYYGNDMTIPVDTPKIRVAAYARVSTDREEQEDSFERQVTYYTGYIKNRTDWEFAGIYADPGITGTQADKRPDFLRMINDCKAGKIQKILCKSIARFARNTVDLLSYIRELRELGIGVYFESGNIDTTTPAGDILLTVLAATAENESRSISTNVKWAMEKKFQNGDVMLNYTRFLGYTRDENKELVIVPEEAEIVKRIYREYLCGYGVTIIAKRLTDDKIPTPSKKNKWGTTVIYNILKNEKYYGTAILGKTIKKDVVSKKRIKNDGTQQMYINEDCIPVIISKETFDAVQEEIKRRGELRSVTKTHNGKYSSKYAFSKMITCGECGSYYRRYALTIKKVYQPVWTCINKKINPSLCSQLYITETSIKNAFLKALHELVVNIDTLKSTLIDNIKSVVMNNEEEKLEEINKEIEKLQQEMIQLYKDKSLMKITEEEYSNRGTIVKARMDLLRKDQQTLETTINKTTLNKFKAQELLNQLEIITNINEFDDEIFKSLVEGITIRNRYDVEFNFKVGIKIVVRAE